MIRVSPLPVRVRCDWFDGRPRSIRLADQTLPITTIVRVRREASAYPVASGPRTVFQVVTPAATLDLAFHHRDRRWLVEGMDPERLSPAA